MPPAGDKCEIADSVPSAVAPPDRTQTYRMSNSGSRTSRSCLIAAWAAPVGRSGRNCPQVRRAAVGLTCFQPAVVGMGAGDLAAGDVGPADVADAGLASASGVVVTGPAELPISQADQDSCQ